MFESWKAWYYTKSESEECRIAYNRVRRILKTAEPAYVVRLAEFQQEFERLINYRRDLRYNPKIEVAMCGYSAMAIKKGLDMSLESDYMSDVMYGHNKNFREVGHYWTRVSYRDTPVLIACATQGQFNREYDDRLLVGKPWNLYLWNLNEYRPRVIRHGSTDTATVEYLKKHDAQLPIADRIMETEFSASSQLRLLHYYNQLVDTVYYSAEWESL